MSSRLFGTDGVRGTAGTHPLDPATVARLGAALVRVLPTPRHPPRLLAGRDTRESGLSIESALASGVASQGARLVTAGVIPTPAISYLTRALDFDAGVVISASHNPFEDNGIKAFAAGGEKLSEDLERAVEALVADATFAPEAAAATASDMPEAAGDYLHYIGRALPDPGRLGRLRVAIDSANGATSVLAPRLFRQMGLEVTPIHADPDGRNINDRCGSTHPQSLVDTVVDGGHRLGVAFDGDGDRAIFVDHRGRIVDGDAVLLMCAKHLQSEGRLPGDVVVATVMSNIGLELALREAGIELVRCPVGDKYVMETMAARQAALGGEQSGHVIFADYLSTGDGLLTALQVLRIMADTGRELADLADELVQYPQVLVNVRVARKPPLEAMDTLVPRVAERMAAVEARLGGRGRLLVRYSGTEPLLRIMIEGEDQQEIQAWANELAEVVKADLG
jgi:phosphoglucosamine mutase